MLHWKLLVQESISEATKYASKFGNEKDSDNDKDLTDFSDVFESFDKEGISEYVILFSQKYRSKISNL